MHRSHSQVVPRALVWEDQLTGGPSATLPQDVQVAVTSSGDPLTPGTLSRLTALALERGAQQL